MTEGKNKTRTMTSFLLPFFSLLVFAAMLAGARPGGEGPEGAAAAGAEGRSARVVSEAGENEGAGAFSVSVKDTEPGREVRLEIADAVDEAGTAVTGRREARIAIDDVYLAETVALDFEAGAAGYTTRRAIEEPGVYEARVTIGGTSEGGTFRVGAARLQPGVGELEVPWLRMVSGLAAVIGVFCIGTWILKRLQQGSIFSRSRYVTVLDCISVGKNLQIIVVEVAGKILILAGGAEGVGRVGEFDRTEFPDPSPSGEGEMEAGFGALLARLRGGKQ